MQTLKEEIITILYKLLENGSQKEKQTKIKHVLRPAST
jgi:hypothetical protein